MNRNHLALFHAVAEAGSISGGAERLHISQPAVSKQLGEFESALGCRLFDRGPRGIFLTAAGKLLAGYARKVNLLETDAEHAMDELRGLKRGRLRIGASTTIGGYWLPNLLTQFHRAHPEIEIDLEIANTAVIQAALIEGRMELGFTEGGSEPEELESSVFQEDELVGIARKGHRFLSKKNLTVHEFCREPFILRERGSGTREVVEAALGGKSITVDPAMSLGSTEAIKRAVIAGSGVAMVSRLTITVEVQSRLLGIVPLKDLKIRRPLHRQQLRGRSLSLPVEAFLKMIGEA